MHKDCPRSRIVVLGGLLPFIGRPGLQKLGSADLNTVDLNPSRKQSPPPTHNTTSSNWVQHSDELQWDIRTEKTDSTATPKPGRAARTKCDCTGLPMLPLNDVPPHPPL